LAHMYLFEDEGGQSHARARKPALTNLSAHTPTFSVHPTAGHEPCYPSACSPVYSLLRVARITSMWPELHRNSGSSTRGNFPVTNPVPGRPKLAQQGLFWCRPQALFAKFLKTEPFRLSVLSFTGNFPPASGRLRSRPPGHRESCGRPQKP
jgi:hypothetical protein